MLTNRLLKMEKDIFWSYTASGYTSINSGLIARTIGTEGEKNADHIGACREAALLGSVLEMAGRRTRTRPDATAGHERPALVKRAQHSPMLFLFLTPHGLLSIPPVRLRGRHS